MVTNTDKVKLDKLGVVRYGWSGSSLKTVCNTLLYSFPTAIARIIAGDSQSLPTHIGFIYGDAASQAPSWQSGDRDVTWAGLADEIKYDQVGYRNMQISQLDLTPTVATVQPGGIGTDYSANAVTFTGVTESGAEAELAFSGSDYETTTGLATGCILYHAVLLSKHNNVYTPLARVSLSNGGYPTKTDTREFSVFWQIAFF